MWPGSVDVVCSVHVWGHMCSFEGNLEAAQRGSATAGLVDGEGRECTVTDRGAEVELRG